VNKFLALNQAKKQHWRKIGQMFGESYLREFPKRDPDWETANLALALMRTRTRVEYYTIYTPYSRARTRFE